MRLPILQRVALPGTKEERLQRLEALLADAATETGYVRADCGEAQWYLFCAQGLTWCAGSEHGDRLVARDVAEFFTALEAAEHVEYRPTDLPLFLCTAVLFRKAPSAQIPTELLDGDTLLRHVKQTGKDAVIVVRRQDARSLVFCRGGLPAALYPAEGERFPPASDLADRILGYVYEGENYREITLDLYDQIGLPPAPDGKRKPGAYSAPAAPAYPEITLAVRLGERTVFHFPMRSECIGVGRGLDNELQLDNLSVSRRHAVIRRMEDGSLLVVDQGSHNGLLYQGRSLGEVRLRPGEEVGIGKYVLAYLPEPLEASQRVAPPERRTPALTAREPTMALPSRSGPPPRLLAEDGSAYTVRGLVFTFGRQPTSDVRLKGLFVAPVHARIRRTPDGRYQIEHVAGRRAVRVNGAPVHEALLSDGDEIEVTGRRFRFHHPAG